MDVPRTSFHVSTFLGFGRSIGELISLFGLHLAKKSQAKNTQNVKKSKETIG
jgi:hypothetical protein